MKMKKYNEIWKRAEKLDFDSEPVYGGNVK